MLIGDRTLSLLLEQPGEIHVFGGAEHPAKEWDCVLIYDEETGVIANFLRVLCSHLNSSGYSQTFTLEKLDSSLVLTYERKTTTTRPNPSRA